MAYDYVRMDKVFQMNYKLRFLFNLLALVIVLSASSINAAEYTGYVDTINYGGNNYLCLNTTNYVYVFDGNDEILAQIQKYMFKEIVVIGDPVALKQKIHTPIGTEIKLVKAIKVNPITKSQSETENKDKNKTPKEALYGNWKLDIQKIKTDEEEGFKNYPIRFNLTLTAMANMRIAIDSKFVYLIMKDATDKIITKKYEYVIKQETIELVIENEKVEISYHERDGTLSVFFTAYEGDDSKLYWFTYSKDKASNSTTITNDHPSKSNIKSTNLVTVEILNEEDYISEDSFKKDFDTLYTYEIGCSYNLKISNHSEWKVSMHSFELESKHSNVIGSFNMGSIFIEQIIDSHKSFTKNTKLAQQDKTTKKKLNSQEIEKYKSLGPCKLLRKNNSLYLKRAMLHPHPIVFEPASKIDKGDAHKHLEGVAPIRTKFVNQIF